MLLLTMAASGDEGSQRLADTHHLRVIMAEQAVSDRVSKAGRYKAEQAARAAEMAMDDEEALAAPSPPNGSCSVLK